MSLGLPSALSSMLGAMLDVLEISGGREIEADAAGALSLLDDVGRVSDAVSACFLATSSSAWLISSFGASSSSPGLNPESVPSLLSSG